MEVSWVIGVPPVIIHYDVGFFSIEIVTIQLELGYIQPLGNPPKKIGGFIPKTKPWLIYGVFLLAKMAEMAILLPYDLISQLFLAIYPSFIAHL
jgi:hypothetical protein